MEVIEYRVVLSCPPSNGSFRLSYYMYITTYIQLHKRIMGAFCQKKKKEGLWVHTCCYLTASLLGGTRFSL